MDVIPAEEVASIKPSWLVWVSRLCIRILGVVFWLLLTFLSVPSFVFSYNVDEKVAYVDRPMIPDAVRGWAHPTVDNVPHESNGIMLALGLYCLAFSWLILNAALRRAAGRGPMDWLLARPWLACPVLLTMTVVAVGRPLAAADVSAHLPNLYLVLIGGGTFALGMLMVYILLRRWVYAAFPLGLALAAAFLLSFLWIADTRAHLDPDEAAEAFRTQKVEQVRTSGGFVFGPGADGTTHVALASPGLVRSLNRRLIDLKDVPPRPFPMPGILPLLTLLALAVYAILWTRGECNGSVRVRAALLFGLLTVYLAWWFTAAVRLPTWLDGEINIAGQTIGAYYVQHFVLAVAGLGFSVGAARKLADERLSKAAQAGWGALLFTVHLTFMAGVYLVYYQTPGTPALLWQLVYITLGALVWWAIVPAPRVEEGS